MSYEIVDDSIKEFIQDSMRVVDDITYTFQTST